MQTRALIIVGLMVVATIPVGCEPWNPFDTEPDTVAADTAPADQPETAAVTDPRDAELAQREAELANMRDAYAGLEEQHRQLAEEAQEMEWVNDQLLATIRDLDSTIEERDRLVMEVEQLQVENIRLNKRIQIMDAELTVYRDQLETMRQMRSGAIEPPTDSEPEPNVEPEADAEPAVDIPAKPEAPASDDAE